MGRPRLHEHARTVNASLKITAVEKSALVDAYGSVHKGLRAALDAALTGTPPRKKRTTRRTKAPAPPVVEPTATEVEHQPTLTAPCRVHQAYTETSREISHGMLYITKTCGDCGHVTTSSRPA